jgi:hypothetical protein
VKVSGMLVYDYDQDKDIQLSQSLGVGLDNIFKNLLED